MPATRLRSTHEISWGRPTKHRAAAKASFDLTSFKIKCCENLEPRSADGTFIAFVAAMLRITRSTTDGTTLLKLEGKLLAAWAAELLEQSKRAGAVDLDLSHVSYVDRAGLAALADLLARGARIVACSGFVAQLLRMETR